MGLKEEIKGFVKEYPIVFLIVPATLIFLTAKNWLQIGAGMLVFITGLVYGSVIRTKVEKKDEL